MLHTCSDAFRARSLPKDQQNVKSYLGKCGRTCRNTIGEVASSVPNICACYTLCMWPQVKFSVPCTSFGSKRPSLARRDFSNLELLGKYCWVSPALLTVRRRVFFQQMLFLRMLHHWTCSSVIPGRVQGGRRYCQCVTISIWIWQSSFASPHALLERPFWLCWQEALVVWRVSTKVGLLRLWCTCPWPYFFWHTSSDMCSAGRLCGLTVFVSIKQTCSRKLPY